MSNNSKDTKTPTPEEIESVFSYLQKVLIAYVKHNYHGEFKETIPVEDDSLNETNTEETETSNETKDHGENANQGENTKPSTYNRYYGRRYYNNYNNGYRRSYYNGKYAYNGVPRRQGYRKYKDSYNGVPGQVDPEEDASNQ